MPFNINDFRAALKFGGARSSLFKVKITNPITTVADADLTMKCQAASLPGWNNQAIEVYYYGRSIKVAGNRSFQDWSTTIINDEDFKIRNALETWSNAINTLEGNIRNLPSSEQALYKSTAEVTQMSQTGLELRTYKFSGIFPNGISAINGDWGSTSVETFDVNWSYDYFFLEPGPTGNAGGK